MNINYKELFEKSSIENIQLKDEIKKYIEEINQLKEHLKNIQLPKEIKHIMKIIRMRLNKKSRNTMKKVKKKFIKTKSQHLKYLLF